MENVFNIPPDRTFQVFTVFLKTAVIRFCLSRHPYIACFTWCLMCFHFEPSSLANLPRGRYPHARSGRYPRAHSGQYPHAHSGRYPRAHSGRYPHARSGRYPHAHSGRYPRAHSGRYRVPAAGGTRMPAAGGTTCPQRAVPACPQRAVPACPPRAVPACPQRAVPACPQGPRWRSRLSDVPPTTEVKCSSPVSNIARGRSSSTLCRKSWVSSGFSGFLRILPFPPRTGIVGRLG